MSPLIAYDTTLSGERPARYRTLVGEYGCPTQLGRLKAFIFPDGLNKSADKGQWNNDNKQFGDYTPNSYMASGPMQSFGKSVSWGSGSRTTRAFVPSSGWNVQYPNYEPRLDRVGQASEKVFATDGTRYLDQQKLLDFDPQPSEALYGSFADGGAWYSRSGAFGVRPGSKTWDDEIVPADGGAAAGEQLELSYRHGCLRELGVEVRTNKGTMNALFHDGHVERLNDRQSREVSLWYPKGSIHKTGNDIGLTKLPNGFEVP
jgi:prepilin-type processing-associated H-X9-DG protein